MGITRQQMVLSNMMLVNRNMNHRSRTYGYYRNIPNIFILILHKGIRIVQRHVTKRTLRNCNSVREQRDSDPHRHQ